MPDLDRIVDQIIDSDGYPDLYFIGYQQHSVHIGIAIFSVA